MAFQIVIRDSAGTQVGSLWTGHLDRSYLLLDGRRCEMPQTVGWCPDCHGFVAAEAVPPLFEIDETVAALRSGSRGFEAWQRSRGEPRLCDHFLDERWEWYARTTIERLGRVREWRLLRRGPPHCLSCFSTEVRLFREHAAEVTHPRTGQRLSVSIGAHLGMACHWEYTVEGLPLAANSILPRRYVRTFP